MQVQSAGRDAYRLSVGQALAKMWREEGWRGFMRGNGTNCIRIVPYSAVQFSCYNFYKRIIFESYPGADLAPVTRLVCSGIAGITSVFCTYPLTLSARACPFNRPASPSWAISPSSCLTCGPP